LRGGQRCMAHQSPHNSDSDLAGPQFCCIWYCVCYRSRLYWVAYISESRAHSFGWSSHAQKWRIPALSTASRSTYRLWGCAEAFAVSATYIHQIILAEVERGISAKAWSMDRLHRAWRWGPLGEDDPGQDNGSRS
jgi:hypothetical protein